MHSVWISLLSCAFAMAHPFQRAAPSTITHSKDFYIQEYSIEAASAKFEFDVDDPLSQLTSPLVFEVQVFPHGQPSWEGDIGLNGQPVSIPSPDPLPSGEDQPTTSSTTLQPFIVSDALGQQHDIVLSVLANIFQASSSDLDASDSNEKKLITLRIVSVDGIQLQSWKNNHFGFDVRPTNENRLYALYGSNGYKPVRFAEFQHSFSIEEKSDYSHTNSLTTDMDSETSSKDISADFRDHISADGHIDVEAEMRSLLQLENEAANLQAMIVAKRQRISKCLKTHRDELSLRELLDQCDGIVCAAKVVAQRICDKIGIETTSSLGDAQAQLLNSQHVMSIASDSEKSRLSASNSTAATSYPSISRVKQQGLLDHNNPPSLSNILISALSAIASIIGLAALWSFLRRKFLPMRTLVERDADMEERRNARAYRRAARRAYLARRWNAFTQSINCFRAPEENKVLDYDEKRALILQDAFLEQSPELVEKGDVMEAEIRELRHAHELVASLVRVGERRYTQVLPRHDPPPPFVPLPYTPNSRSRASSATLPSYTSESLPGYRSASLTDASSRRSNSIASITDGFGGYSPTSLSEDESLSRSTAPSQPPRSVSSRYTPTSSVIDMSPRPSEETLRTRLSKSSRS